MKPKDIGGSSTRSEAEKLLDVERSIVRFSRDFAGAPVEKIDAKIDEALKLIVECLGIDRCAFWEITENFNDVVMSHSYIVPQVNGKFSKINPHDFP